MPIPQLVLIIIAATGFSVGIYSSSLFDVRVFRKASVRDDEVIRLVIQAGLGMFIFAGTLGLSIGLSSAVATPRAIHEQVFITIIITSLCAIGGSCLMVCSILLRLYIRSKLKRRLRDTKSDPQFKEAMDQIEAQIEALPKDLWKTFTK